MRAVSQTAIDFIKAHEGCSLIVYLDSAHILTVGYGHVTTLPLGSVITQAQADAYLEADVGVAATRLCQIVKPDVISSLTENQYAALTSFAFNVGANPDWTIWKVLNARQYDQVPAELMRFVNAGGKKVQGLVNRRADEVKLWSTDEPGSVEDGGSSAVTRGTPTPPTSKDPTPASLQPKIIAGALTAVTAGSSAVASVTSEAQPFAGKSHLVDHVLVILATAGFCMAVLTGVLMWLSHRQANR